MLRCVALSRFQTRAHPPKPAQKSIAAFFIGANGFH
jgi:hypothetical protein